MSENKPINPNHDHAVRALALEHAVTLAHNTGVGSSQADAIVAAAEKFRVFLTVPGASGYHVVQHDDVLRANLPPKGTVVLPSTINVASPPAAPVSDALATELREFRQFIERVIAEERSGSGGKAG